MQQKSCPRGAPTRAAAAEAAVIPGTIVTSTAGVPTAARASSRSSTAAAMKYGWVDVAEVVTALQGRAPRTNVVVTGRYAPDEIIEIADTVTEMVKAKHAMDAGIGARKGIEY